LNNPNEARYTIIANGMSTTVDIPEQTSLNDNLLSTPSPTPGTQIPVTEEEQGDDKTNLQVEIQATPPAPTSTEIIKPTLDASVTVEQATQVQPTLNQPNPVLPYNRQLNQPNPVLPHNQRPLKQTLRVNNVLIKLLFMPM
jgi:hypothetical protein